jgi:methionyl-tRNA formyltransferase
MRAILVAMRIVFMGSPDFALPTLRRLIESAHDIVAVYTQPDRPAGRGRKSTPPPVKTLALEHGLDVRQPRSISAPAEVERLRALAPDIGVLAAYGQLLRQPVLDVPPLGILNVHASLLPRWRGASPIPAAILAGDAETGATLMQIVLALDAGPMLARSRVRIADDDTTASLTPRIAEAGAALLMDVLPRWQSGELQAEPQDDALATYAHEIQKSDALVHWSRDDAATIARQVRAYNPWPMAYSYLDGAPLRIVRAAVSERRYEAGPPGTVFAADGAAGFCVATKGLDLHVLEVQPAGGRVMSAAAYLRGHREIIGKHFTSP